MDIHKSLPFNEGDMAEAKSFEAGYRGAWFRCKIQEIRRKQGKLVYALEYYDYPDEKIELKEVYEKPKNRSRSLKKAKRELMVRPDFPPLYNESEVLNANTISKVVVVVDGVWRVGDFVDWRYAACFWSGTITEIKGDDEVKIKLLEPPLGEGHVYEVSCRDLRPSLDWSPEKGWTVPKLPEKQNDPSRVRLIHPRKQDSLPRSLVDVAECNVENVRATPSSSLELNESTSSHTSTRSLPSLHKSTHSEGLVEKNIDSEKDILQTSEAPINPSAGCSTIGRPSCSDGISSTCGRDASDEAPGPDSAQEQNGDYVSEKKMHVNVTVSLNSVAPDSLESTIIDLEELANKVKWLRRILKFGIPSNSGAPVWKFLQDSASLK